VSTAAAQPARREASKERPRLAFFRARNSGRSRRVEGYLSQVLQRRRNHDSFNRVRGRLASPRGCRDIEQLLAPWLR
jgi:hypothetical protein